MKLHLEGKTIRGTAKEVPMLMQDISKRTKEYERKKRLQVKREDNNEPNKIKKLSLTSRSVKLFVESKKT